MPQTLLANFSRGTAYGYRHSMNLPGRPPSAQLATAAFKLHLNIGQGHSRTVQGARHLCRQEKPDSSEQAAFSAHLRYRLGHRPPHFSAPRVRKSLIQKLTFSGCLTWESTPTPQQFMEYPSPEKDLAPTSTLMCSHIHV